MRDGRDPLAFSQIGDGGEFAWLQHPIPAEDAHAPCLDQRAIGPAWVRLHEAAGGAFISTLRIAPRSSPWGITNFRALLRKYQDQVNIC